MSVEHEGPWLVRNRTPRGPTRCWAIIDVDAFRRNLRTVVERVFPAKVFLVLKADAYGHGAIDLADAASGEAGATGLCVATQGEGIELREAGIQLPILVLSTVPDARTAREFDLSVSVSSPSDIEALIRTGARGLNVHLEIDTGMHRMGASPTAAPEMVRALERGGLSLEGMYSHFACADEADPERTLDQTAKFREVTGSLSSGAMRHLANSAGSLAEGGATFDAVRVGGALYGLWTGEATWVKEITEPVMTVQAVIASLVDVPAGEGVGYGLLDPAREDRRIAILSIGYADGLPRGLGCGGQVLLGGERKPTVGRISMDWTAVDVTGSNAAIGDVVTLLGSEGGTRLWAEDQADRAGTLSYELTCSLGSRLERRVLRSTGAA